MLWKITVLWGNPMSSETENYVVAENVMDALKMLCLPGNRWAQAVQVIVEWVADEVIR